MADLDTPLPPAELEAVTATEAKNSLGAVLDRVMVDGSVAITKHDEVKAVLLSVRQYEALLAGQKDPLAELEQEFEGLVRGMQTPQAREAGRTLFDASAEQLGAAAVAARRRR